MKTAMQARPGTVIKLNGELLLVVKHEMRRGGRGATNVMMRLKNLIVGNTVDRVVDSEEKFEDITLERAKAEFLYQSGDTFAFMNQDTYETVELHGNTADGKVDKLVKLETGLELRVPGFVNQDESIVINTETGDYLERAK